MRRLRHTLLAIGLALLLVLQVRLDAAVALVANAIAHGVNGATTGGVTTTGATLLVACVSSYSVNAEGTISDSNGNDWIPLTAYSNTAGSMRVRILYAYAKSGGGALVTGAGHTFTNAGTSNYTSVAFAAFSGTDTTSAVYNSDVTGINDFLVANSTPMQIGSLTVAANDLMVSCEGVPFGNATVVLTIDQSFTITDQYHSSGVTEGSGLAYWINTGSSTAKNPGWDPDIANYAGAGSNATFKAGSGGGGGTTHPRLMLLGVGGQ